jgi:hypothetical protein
MRHDTEASIAAWLDDVANGTVSMSQRRLTRLEGAPGGVEAVCALARARGVHLAVFTDEQGVALVAASRHPIQVLC